MNLRSIFCLCLIGSMGGVMATPAAADPISQPPILASVDLPAHVYAFELEGSNGYRIEIQAMSAGLGTGSRVYVIVSRKDSIAGYGAPAIVTESVIRGDLGPLGRVDVTINRSGREKTIPIRCSGGDASSFEPASLEGLVEFHGERGYTGGRATRLPLLPPVTSFCGGGSGRGESRGSGLPGARLQVRSFADGRALTLRVNKNHPRSRALFTAEIRERSDGVRIYRAVEGWLPATAFVYEPRLRTASLRPPAPFSGAASLRRSPNSVSPLWSGDLKVSFPGRTARLAGPGAQASLVHACFQLSDRPRAESC
jgi:hypothetical protein